MPCAATDHWRWIRFWDVRMSKIGRWWGAWLRMPETLRFLRWATYALSLEEYGSKFDPGYPCDDQVPTLSSYIIRSSPRQPSHPHELLHRNLSIWPASGLARSILLRKPWSVTHQHHEIIGPATEIDLHHIGDRLWRLKGRSTEPKICSHAACTRCYLSNCAGDSGNN